MRRTNRLMVGMVCLSAIVVALLSIPAVSTAQNNPTPTVIGPPVLLGPSVRGELAGSTAELRIDMNPVLGINAASPAYSPTFYEGNAVAGGDVSVDAVGNCVGGYTTAEPTVGIVWVDESGPVDIQFVPAKQRGMPVGLLLWDLMNAQWWCTSTYAESNMLSFSNMSKGVYFIWVVTQGTDSVTGVISAISPPPLPGS